MRPTELVVFGNARGGTPLMQAEQTIGIDLPLKALVFEDAAGKVWLSYNDPHWLAARHRLGAAVAQPVDAMVAMQALRDNAAALYDPSKFTEIMAAMVGADNATAKHFFYPNSPNPPILFLILAPFSLLPYFPAVLTWEAVTLLGCVVIVYLIVRRPTAIALVLASPFGVWDLYWGQTGLLRATLLGSALLTLERRPVLTGVFIGCLTYKPQFGIVFPVALVAARHWRAAVSAVITAVVLVGVSIVAFGIGPWEAFPHALRIQADLVLLHKIPGVPVLSAGQTIYGLVRILHGSAAFAWLAQACITAGIAVIVWLVWRSSTRYKLKAALLSAATLIATPYAWFHDLTPIAIPIAFLARDQIDCGLLRGEQTVWSRCLAWLSHFSSAKVGRRLAG